MTTPIENSSAAVRAKLDHPIIDGDSHIVEFTPAWIDYLRRVGGGDVVQQLTTRPGRNWWRLSWEERRYHRVMVPTWWALPTEATLDRATVTLPRLYHDRLPELGLDFVVLYPSQGLNFPHIDDDTLRPIVCRAFNEFTADHYGEYGDRLTVAAVIPLHTPDEGIAELEHAKALGHKVAMIPAYVRRPVPEIAERYPELASRITWLDSYGIDSQYDYDPFWAKCVELGFPVVEHSLGMGFDDRRSISNYMYNHMGHFAAAGELLCKSLLMGGVTKRFPTLKFAFLEGGVANACRLYADIIGRWEKRGVPHLPHLDPSKIDLALAQQLFAEYGGDMVRGRMEDLERTLGMRATVPEEIKDNFAAMGVETAEDFRDRFIPHFYFGCEADDPITAWAFNERVNPFGAKIRAIMSADLGHWDVADMGDAVAEAYEPVEKGLMSPEDFRDFAFTNQVTLYASTNPAFFRGTAVERDAAAVLGR